MFLLAGLHEVLVLLQCLHEVLVLLTVPTLLRKACPIFFPADFIGYKNLNSYAAVHYTVSYVSLIGVQVDSHT